MKDFKIPIPVIIMMFVFGAWPIGVFLIILRVIAESQKEKENRDQNQTQFMNGTGFNNTGRVSNYSAPSMDPPPFTSDPIVGARNMNRRANTEINAIRQRAPYTSRADLDAMADRITRVEFSQLITIAPYISRDTLGRLAVRASNIKAVDLIQLAPFLSEETLDILVEKADGLNTYVITSLAPFLGQKTLTRLAGRNYGSPQNAVDTVKPEAEKKSGASSAAGEQKQEKREKQEIKQIRKMTFIPSDQKFMSAATVFSTLAFALSLIFSLLVLTGAVTDVVNSGIAASTMDSIITASVSSSITALIYLFRRFSRTRDYRIMSYLSALRGERFCSIKKLADMADTSTSRVVKDLQYMQSKGLLGAESVIDRRLGYVILFKDAWAEAEADAGFIRPTAVSREPKSPDEAAAEMSEHEKILRRIRELNDDIDNVSVSEKIDKIEELTRKIFKLVEEKPEMEPQLGSFLSYYLPTTLKLLNSYAYFEDQGIHGENIDAGMRNIEETLDMLIDGYKNQLDKLFESDTLDVATDINVLEQMMKAEGITGGSDFEIREKSADVAADKPAQKTFEETYSGGVAFAAAPDEDADREGK